MAKDDRGVLRRRAAALLSPLQIRHFRRLWLAQIISEIGDWFYSLAVYSLILELTGSAKMVGIAVVLQVLPQALASPTAGVINDRVRRQRVMILADLARAAIVICMMFVRTPSNRKYRIILRCSVEVPGHDDVVEAVRA